VGIPVDVNKNKPKKSSPDPPPQKEQTNIWSKKWIRLKNKVSWQTSEETKRDRDMWQKWCVLKKICRMETSFLIILTLVSNNNYWNPRSRIITTEIPGNVMNNSGSHSHIHLHYQYTMDETTRSWSERERKRETQPTAILTLVSNNNEWTPKILRNQIWVTLTHTPALPIHNGRKYQELKKERDTGKQPTVRLRLKESERERDRTLKKAHVIPECHNKH